MKRLDLGHKLTNPHQTLRLDFSLTPEGPKSQLRGARTQRTPTTVTVRGNVQVTAPDVLRSAIAPNSEKPHE